MFTAHKRSLGQGNVFTLVCHSVHRGGLHPGGLHPGVSASGREVDLHPGGSAFRRRGVGRPPIGYYGIQSTNGWYASYWNAFLFQEGNRIGYSWYQVPRFSRENLL